MLLLSLTVLLTFSGVLAEDNIHGFKAKNIDGQEVSFDKYKGKCLIVVNVASKCGLTAINYDQLNQLYEKYSKDGLAIAAFPCNQFMNQEPGTDAEIKQFMAGKKVQFDAYSKVEVNGDNAHPIYKWLKTKIPGDVPWNFQKYLIGKDGIPMKAFGPKSNPMEMEPDIQKCLK